MIVSMFSILGIHSAHLNNKHEYNSAIQRYELGHASLMSIWLLALPIMQNMPHTDVVTRLHYFYYGQVGSIISSCIIVWVLSTCEKKCRKVRKLKGFAISFFQACITVSCIVHLGSQCVLYFWFGKIGHEDSAFKWVTVV